MFERFVKSARDVVKNARGHALRLNQTQVRAEHLLLALAGPEAGIAAEVLAGNGMTRAKIESAIASTTALESPEGPLTRADADAMKKMGVDLDEVVREVEGALGAGALRPVGPRHKRPEKRLSFSPEAKRALAAGLGAAREEGCAYIDAGHVLLGVLAQKRSLAVELLGEFDATPEGLRHQVLTQQRRAS